MYFTQGNVGNNAHELLTSICKTQNRQIVCQWLADILPSENDETREKVFYFFLFFYFMFCHMKYIFCVIKT